MSTGTFPGEESLRGRRRLCRRMGPSHKGPIETVEGHSRRSHSSSGDLVPDERWLIEIGLRNRF